MSETDDAKPARGPGRPRKLAQAPAAPAAAAPMDPLLAAIIDKLPRAGAVWPMEARASWLRMLAMAFDVAYGPAAEIHIGTLVSRAPVAAAAAPQAISTEKVVAAVAASYAAPPEHVYCVDPQGFVLRNGLSIDRYELPPHCEILDFRTGADFGDQAALMWKSTGYSDHPLGAGQVLVAPRHAGNGAAHVEARS